MEELIHKEFPFSLEAVISRDTVSRLLISIGGGEQCNPADYEPMHGVTTAMRQNRGERNRIGDNCYAQGEKCQECRAWIDRNPHVCGYGLRSKE